MILNIRNYGSIEIKEPIIKEIISTKEIQRLKGVSQHAVSFFHPWMNVSRFEHSIGVYCLLKKLGARLEEQIAGLIHDISHTAFSHVIDFVFKRSQEDFHEIHSRTILENSKIPEILEKNNLDFNRIISNSNFPLLEKPLPDLCADRVDYFLRDSYLWKILSFDELNKILNNLVVFENQMIFIDIKIAKLAAQRYNQTNLALWATPRYIGSYHVLAEAIRRGIKIRAVNKQDLFSEDSNVLEKLKLSNDHEILSNLNLLNPNFKVIVVEENQEPDLCMKKKLRYLNPRILINNSLQKLSDIDLDFKNQTDEYIKNQKKIVCVKIIR